MSRHKSIRATAAPWYNGVEILIREKTTNGFAVAKDIIMEEIVHGISVDPSLTMSMENAQILMDDLWNSGLRPTEGTGSAGSLMATEKHLNDMRKIVSKKLDVNL